LWHTSARSRCMGNCISCSSRSRSTLWQNLFGDNYVYLEDVIAAPVFEHDPDHLLHNLTWAPNLGLMLSNQDCKLLAHDPFTGLQRWSFQPGLEEIMCFQYADELGYFFLGGKGLRELMAFDKNHKLVWEADAGISSVHNMCWSPKMGVLMVLGTHSAAAIEPLTGQVLWLMTPSRYELRCVAAKKARFFFGGEYESRLQGQMFSISYPSTQIAWAVRGEITGRIAGSVQAMCLDDMQEFLFCGGNNGKVVCLLSDTGCLCWNSSDIFGKQAFCGFQHRGVTCLTWASYSRLLLAGCDDGAVAAIVPESGESSWMVMVNTHSVEYLTYIPSQRMFVCSGCKGEDLQTKNREDTADSELASFEFTGECEPPSERESYIVGLVT